MTTKCSFSFRCTHAARHAPHTCQKSCREGGADREGDEEGELGGERETEEERRRRRGWRMHISRWNDLEEGDRKKVGILGDGELRTMVIYEEGEKRENEGITCHENEKGRLIRAGENHQQSTMATSSDINIR